MWNCKRCEKPVFFAERKQSIGFDWHPECLRCDECGRRLNPGQHAEHKSAPYCHVPCYGVLFGPQLFGHGTCADSHASLGRRDSASSTPTTATPTTSTPPAASTPLSTDGSNGSGASLDGALERQPSRDSLQRKLKIYNQFYESFHTVIQSRERNGRLILDGVLKLYWGVTKLLQFKEDDDQRPIVRKRMSHYIEPAAGGTSSEENDDSDSISAPVTPVSSPMHGAARVQSVPVSAVSGLLRARPTATSTTPDTVNGCAIADRGDTVTGDPTTPGEPGGDSVPVASPPPSAPASVAHGAGDSSPTDESTTEPPLRRPAKSRILRRRPGKRMNKSRLKRRCSINGHFYNRETSVFTPPHGSSLSVWVTSLVTSREMINLVLDKYRVEDRPDSFALYIVWDSGEQRRLRDDEFPLIARVMIGPSELAARLFLMDTETTMEIRSEVAQYINLSDVECTSILQKYREEEELQVVKVKEKYAEMKARIRARLRELKVQL